MHFLSVLLDFYYTDFQFAVKSIFFMVDSLNEASWIKRGSWHLRLPGENDYDASGFLSFYAPNNFIGNCVSAAYFGFYFNNFHYVRDEVRNLTRIG